MKFLTKGGQLMRCGGCRRNRAKIVRLHVNQSSVSAFCENCASPVFKNYHIAALPSLKNVDLWLELVEIRDDSVMVFKNERGRFAVCANGSRYDPNSCPREVVGFWTIVVNLDGENRPEKDHFFCKEHRPRTYMNYVSHVFTPDVILELKRIKR